MHKQAGFTLLELMIAVAVVGILAAVAYPSYRAQIMRSNRSEAQNALLQVQVAQEKFFLQYNRYAKTDTELSNKPSDATPGLGIKKSTDHGNYTLTLNGTDTTYDITATAAGAQADDKSCSVFSIDETGHKGSKDDKSTDSTGCWK